MTGLLHGAAVLCCAAGLLAGACVLAKARDARQALAVLLDFLLAAGLLRLTATATWTALATTALIVLIRKGVMTVGFGGVRSGAVGRGRARSDPPAPPAPPAPRGSRGVPRPPRRPVRAQAPRRSAGA